MNESIDKLKIYFNIIKNKKLNKSLRIGTTGIGYTFENLINKKEDNNFLPDFEGIEIKTKLGYTKSSTTLFCLTPKKDNNDLAIKFILENFGYPNKSNRNFKNFKGDVYSTCNNFIGNKYIFKLRIDYKEQKIYLIIADNSLNIINNSIFWSFEDLKIRLYTKLNYLAYIKGYPYHIDGETFYKYTNLTIYKLKNFETFINLIEQGYIYITFNIGIFDKEYRYGEIHDRGTAFKLKKNSINKLFDKIDSI